MTTKRNSGRKYEMTLAAGAVGPATQLSYDTTRNAERPAAERAIYARCRKLAGDSSFLSSFLPLKLAFYNYGFSVGLGPMAKGDPAKLTEWLATELKTEAEYEDPSSREKIKIELHTTNAAAINALARDCWNEFNLLDVCIGQWMDDAILPTTLQPEKCRYFDTLGLPVLYYTHGLTAQQKLLLPPDKQKRFEKGEILLNAEEGEHFNVLKRGAVGSGLPKSALYSMFTTFGEIDSKEQGFHARSYLMRAATRHHKLGHQYTQGPAAGKPTYFWNTRRHAGVVAAFKDRVGPQDYTSNFDHTIEYPWPDIATFDEVAWKGTDRRLRNWGGPIAQMLVSEKVIEGGLGVLRAWATQDRKDMADFLLPIIKKGFKVPEEFDLQITWSDLVFIDPKQAGDLIKFAVQNGVSSVQTARQVFGLNHELENARKATEADDTDATKHYRPAWDASHAMAPQAGETTATIAESAAKNKAAGQDPGSTNGRPTGAGDGANANR